MGRQQGGGQLPHRDDEARLHQRVRGGGRPQGGQDCGEPEWEAEQDWGHLSQVRHLLGRHREVVQQPATLQTVWETGLDDIGRNYGSRGGEKKTPWRQDPWLLLLEILFKLLGHVSSLELPNK